MTTTRARLPNRRPSVRQPLNWRGLNFTLTAGFTTSGKVAEAFLDTAGSARDGHLQHVGEDLARLVSRQLQSGTSLTDLARSFGGPTSLVGTVAAALIKLEKEFSNG